MSITCACEGCGRTFQVAEAMAGKKARCKCGGVTVIPAPSRSKADTTPGFDPFGLAEAGEAEVEAEPVELAPRARAGRPAPGVGPRVARKKPKRRGSTEALAMAILLGVAVLAGLVGIVSVTPRVPALALAVVAGVGLGGLGGFSYFRAVGMPGIVTLLLLCFLPVLGLIAWTLRWKEAPRAALAIWLGGLIASFASLEIVLDHRPQLRPGFGSVAAPRPDPSRFDPSLSAPRVANPSAVAGFRAQAPTGNPAAKLVYNLESPDNGDRTMAWLGLPTLAVADEHRAAVLDSTRKHLKDPSALIRLRAVEMLVRWSPPDVDLVPALIPLLGDDINIYSAALQALEKRKDPRALDAIAAQMDFEDRVGTASVALAGYGPAAEDTLIKVLGRPNPGAKFRACVELGDGAVGTAKCLPALEKLARGPDPKLAQAARAATETIKNRPR